MTDENDLREMDIDAAEARLVDMIEQLDALRHNPEVNRYAAEEYIDEAVTNLTSALADVNRAREE